MKLKLLIVSVTAVFAVDSRDLPVKPPDEAQNLPHEPVGHDSADEERDKEDGSWPIADELKQLNSSEVDVHIMKDENIRNMRSLRALKCESTICGILGGSCITNETICSGWLVSDGCRGANCHCCIPGSLEMKMKHFELELQSMKDDLANSSLQLKIEFQSMIENITHTRSENQKEFQFFKENLTNANSNLASMFKTIEQNITDDISKLKSSKINQGGCPKGLFKQSAFNQCFKYYNDKSRSYTAAKSKCAEGGFVLAKPYDPIGLRNYMIMRYGDALWPWIGAKGTGSYVKWDRNGTTLTSSNPMWYSGYPSGKTSSSYCLMLTSTASYLKSNPNTAFSMGSCTNSQYTLCELLTE